LITFFILKGDWKKSTVFLLHEVTASTHTYFILLSNYLNFLFIMDFCFSDFFI